LISASSGSRRELHAGDLSGCLRELLGADVSAKDFLTWHATVLAAVAPAVSTQGS
jgi:DNA topoisomerase IB